MIKEERMLVLLAETVNHSQSSVENFDKFDCGGYHSLDVVRSPEICVLKPWFPVW